MNKAKKLIKIIAESIKNNKNFKFVWNKNNKEYYVFFKVPEGQINIPYIIIIPKTQTLFNQIILQANECYTDSIFEMIINGGIIGEQLLEITQKKPSIMIIPLLPSMEKTGIYFQQLSKECFELKRDNVFYRIDNQIIQIINRTKQMLKDKFDIECNPKIIINGYSCSAVFAQRFALIHPEIVDVAFIGGAIGSIPLPDKNIGYPIGIKDYNKLFNKDFDILSYSKIKFIYYVGELETAMKSKNRVDENGNPAPMHDMSYFSKSVPTDVGKEQRNMLGTQLFKRANETIKKLKEKNIDIKFIIIPKRTHNDKSGHGVNEYIVKIPATIYNEICDESLLNEDKEKRQ